MQILILSLKYYKIFNNYSAANIAKIYANVDIGSLIVTISREIGLTQSSDLSNNVFMFTIQPSQINILSSMLDSFFLKDYINFLLICGVWHCPSDEVESEDHHKDYLMTVPDSYLKLKNRTMGQCYTLSVIGVVTTEVSKAFHVSFSPQILFDLTMI